MPLPRPFLWGLRALLFSLSLALPLLGFARPTSTAPRQVPGHFDHYIHRLEGAPADPINLIFYGGDADAVAAAVHGVLGWTVVDGSPMVFVDRGAKRQTGWQMGEQVSRSARLHLRIEQSASPADQDYVLAAIHRDDDAPCGHVGNAFNDAREVVATAFARAGYQVTTVSLGNTKPGPQCDGSFTAGDGAAAIIDLSDSASGG